MNKSVAPGVLPIVLLVAGTCLPIAAFAHPGHVSTSADALRAGFAHPWSGLDHMLAMLALGMWAAQHGRRALLVLPLLFPAVLVAGALFGLGASLTPTFETLIAASVLVLGVLVALRARLPLRYGATLVALIALLHGYAHGAELPAGAGALEYFAGFAAATLLLHALGLALGLLAARRLVPALLPATGGAIAGIGAVLLLLP